MQGFDSLKNNSGIQKLRRTLIIILCVFYIFSTSSEILSPTRGIKHTVLSVIVTILVYSIFYGINIFVVYRYSSLGLRIFAWIRIVITIIAGTLLILTIFALAAVTVIVSKKKINHPTFENDSSSLKFVAIIAAIIGTLAIIVQVIIIVFHFKLARLIDAAQNVPVQSV